MSFIGNLVLFAAVKEFWQSIKNWQSYSHGYGGTHFWLTVYISPRLCLTRNVEYRTVRTPMTLSDCQGHFNYLNYDFLTHAFIATPKRQLIAQKHVKSVHQFFFAQLTLLRNPPNPMLYNAFKSGRHPKSAFSRGAYVPIPWTHPTQHSKLHLDRFSRFCTGHFTMCVKTRLTRDWKNAAL